MVFNYIGALSLWLWADVYGVLFMMVEGLWRKSGACRLCSHRVQMQEGIWQSK